LFERRDKLLDWPFIVLEGHNTNEDAQVANDTALQNDGSLQLPKRPGVSSFGEIASMKQVAIKRGCVARGPNMI
jgi:hypothetical protein